MGDQVRLVSLFLKSIDLLTMLLASVPLADSRSQVSFLYSEGFTKRFTVLGDGSISGVDLSRFKSNPFFRSAFRSEYKISNDECVFVFLGRLCREKGVLILSTLSANRMHINLLDWSWLVPMRVKLCNSSIRSVST